MQCLLDREAYGTGWLDPYCLYVEIVFYDLKRFINQS